MKEFVARIKLLDVQDAWKEDDVYAYLERVLTDEDVVEYVKEVTRKKKRKKKGAKR